MARNRNHEIKQITLNNGDDLVQYFTKQEIKDTFESIGWTEWDDTRIYMWDHNGKLMDRDEETAPTMKEFNDAVAIEISAGWGNAYWISNSCPDSVINDINEYNADTFTVD